MGDTGSEDWTVQDGDTTSLESSMCQKEVPKDMIQETTPWPTSYEGMLRLVHAESREAGCMYRSQYVLRIAAECDLEKLRDAWKIVASLNPLFRTKVVGDKGQLRCVVLLDSDVLWNDRKETTNLSQNDDPQMAGPPEGRLANLEILEQARCHNCTHDLLLTRYHAISDEWSLHAVLQQFQQAYDSINPQKPPCRGLEKVSNDAQGIQERNNFWKSLLGGFSSSHFPSRPMQPHACTFEKQQFSFCLPGSHHTTKELYASIYLSWGMTLSQYTSSWDVVFGVTGQLSSSTRTNTPDGNVHPFRIVMQPEMTVEAALLILESQEQYIRTTDPGTLGDISCLDEDVALACQFQNVLSIFSRSSVDATKAPLTASQGTGKQYPLMVTCDCDDENGNIGITVSHDSESITCALMTWVLHQFASNLERTLMYSKEKLANVRSLSPAHVEQLHTWNAAVPEGIQACAHELIIEKSVTQPNAPAVHAWDGDLSYQDLDRLSSVLAESLRHRSTAPGSFVPIYMEKTKWAVVAMLAVMRIGAAFLLLSSSQPVNRVQDLCRRVQAKIILSSPRLAENLCGFSEDVDLIEIDERIKDGPCDMLQERPLVRPQDPIYLFFTSGSTGEPKGVLVHHAAVATNAIKRGEALQLSQISRVLQFASFSFDACIAEIIFPLVNGGCICIASETQLQGELEQTIRHYAVNRAYLTPSVARSLSSSVISLLDHLSLVGEEYRASDLEMSKHTHLLNEYGPAECAVGATIRKNLTPEGDLNNIGWGVGAVCWVVDPDDVSRRVPIGSVGELLIEGPIVGRGYLNNPDGTNEKFIQPPQWLTTLRQNVHGLCYRTGDLVKYSTKGDGSLNFVGRKDNQVKLRGQRLDLGDIEAHMAVAFPDAKQVLVEVITPANDPDQMVLAGFIFHPRSNLEEAQSDIEIPDMQNSIFATGGKQGFIRRVSDAETYLHSHLPSYMIPTVFLPLRRPVLSSSGKVDRQMLRKAASALSRHTLQSYRAQARHKQPPSTDKEAALRRMITFLFNIEEDEVGLNDHFFHLGGDSLGAMELTKTARKNGYQLTVAAVFEFPILQDLASKMRRQNGSELLNRPHPFALLESSTREAVISHSLESCMAGHDDQIEDIHPATPLQEALFALSMRTPGAYLAYLVFELDANISLSRFQDAWYAVLLANSALRSRIVTNSEHGTFQVVFRDPPRWSTLQEVNDLEIQPGYPLLAFCLSEPDSRPLTFTLAIHHAIYDGWSKDVFLHQLREAYDGNHLRPQSFNALVEYTTSSDTAAAEAYWKDEMAGFHSTPFPTPSPSGSASRATSCVEQSILVNPPSGITTASLMKLAWAVSLSQYTSSDDVVFGMTLSGRDVPVPGIENIVGPVVATVPVRVKLDQNASIKNLLSLVQCRSARMVEFQHLGTQNIRRVSPEAELACRFGNLLVIHMPREKIIKSDIIRGLLNEEEVNTMLHTHALVLVCDLYTDFTVRVQVRFDDQVVTHSEATGLLSQVLHVISVLLSASDNTLLADVSPLSPEGEAALSAWTHVPPKRIDACVHSLVQGVCKRHPLSPAVCAWDGEFTYSELGGLSDQLASHLLHVGVEPKTFVPVILKKTRWAVVAMLAILKVGAAFVLMDPSQPLQRIRGMCEECGSSIVISNKASVPNSADLSIPVICISNVETCWQRSAVDISDRSLPLPVSTESPVYVVFTSGSTGKPKGVIIDHGAFCTLAITFNKTAGLDSQTRMFQFASYAFDASIIDMLAPLLAGGCVCIPSESERTDDLAGSVKRMNANFADFTPSLLQELDPRSFPTIKKIIVGGERMTSAEVRTWSPAVRLLNVYGPAECCDISTLQPNVSVDSDINSVGHPLATDCWIVHPSDHNRLVPIGVVGELLLGGPKVGMGYINNPFATSKAFLSDAPPWLAKFRPDSAFNRLYKTGDLVSYSADGSLRFVGRKDFQIKIRGQRIEPGEIEVAIQKCLPDAPHIVVDAVGSQSGGLNKTLVAFIAVESTDPTTNGNYHPEDLFTAPDEILQERLNCVNAELHTKLPSAMVPAKYLVLRLIPFTISGKVDRRALRETASLLTDEELELYAKTQLMKKQPSTPQEGILQQICASVLRRAPESVSMGESFFHLGGDSIMAMKLVQLGRRNGLCFQVTDVYRSSKIADLVAANH
ncbi:hypothetical protein PMG11_11111 [Penicillium brasilianum]|uniref:Carrier domain-containing protein n=1 Tax=Penicillium brasilianum TaxID=104259 RepID=A0A0F7U102_PENBI|nr:hypothetical protein PMG11_11111 [Penicillium brasilianum]